MNAQIIPIAKGAADHDIYAKIMEQWIQLNYVALKKIIHLPVHNNYMHELKSASTTVLNAGYRSTRQGRVITTTIAIPYIQFDHHSSMASHATSTITHHI